MPPNLWGSKSLNPQNDVNSFIFASLFILDSQKLIFRWIFHAFFAESKVLKKIILLLKYRTLNYKIPIYDFDKQNQEVKCK